jgi:hypothetical protein
MESRSFGRSSRANGSQMLCSGSCRSRAAAEGRRDTGRVPMGDGLWTACSVEKLVSCVLGVLSIHRFVSENKR